MNYMIEIKGVGTSEYWFVSKHDSGWGLTKRVVHAHDFTTYNEAKQAVNQLIDVTPEAMRKFISKDAGFTTTLSFIVLNMKNPHADRLATYNKLYPFTTGE